MILIDTVPFEAKVPTYSCNSDPVQLDAAVVFAVKVFARAENTRKASIVASGVTAVGLGGATAYGIHALCSWDPESLTAGLMVSPFAALIPVVAGFDIHKRLRDKAQTAYDRMTEMTKLRDKQLAENYTVTGAESLLQTPEKNYFYTYESENGGAFRDQLYNNAQTRPILRRAFNRVNAERWLKFARNTASATAVAGATEALIPGGANGVVMGVASLGGLVAAQLSIVATRKSLRKVALDYFAAAPQAMLFHRPQMVANFWHKHPGSLDTWNLVSAPARKIGNAFDRLFKTSVTEISYTAEEIAAARAIVPAVEAQPIEQTTSLAVAAEAQPAKELPVTAATEPAMPSIAPVETPTKPARNHNRELVAGSLIVLVAIGTVAVMASRSSVAKPGPVLISQNI